MNELIAWSMLSPSYSRSSSFFLTNCLTSCNVIFISYISTRYILSYRKHPDVGSGCFASMHYHSSKDLLGCQLEPFPSTNSFSNLPVVCATADDLDVVTNEGIFLFKANLLSANLAIETKEWAIKDDTHWVTRTSWVSWNHQRASVTDCEAHTSVGIGWGLQGDILAIALDAKHTVLVLVKCEVVVNWHSPYTSSFINWDVVVIHGYLSSLVSLVSVAPSASSLAFSA
nr:MAG TPA: hypothetical protein [Caudoviricetes sp.]